MRGFGQNRSGRWRGCSLSDESKDYGKSLREEPAGENEAESRMEL